MYCYTSLLLIDALDLVRANRVAEFDFTAEERQA